MNAWHDESWRKSNCCSYHYICHSRKRKESMAIRLSVYPDMVKQTRLSIGKVFVCVNDRVTYRRESR